ncbi:M20/M25/M40 family metallo-hydrolase [Janthinobacterium agaricidamnosum]|uniref:Bacterial leucyl aminopeptidase n=1 Tax=Janthinobacterium agaricidamnosum NBRC 102515 = DSM 9628 TaxID=1349767 RepID=W0V6S8_9BURK|nr:M20/M25/M40 family metallo-hydrolase [Janthinobacterium agaricidamnosum]CDG84529.1 bacterial leucyl aminopeptidase [Janthinobacterium agaricidamnosum NBRC 102515 = DSM 9628]
MGIHQNVVLRRCFWFALFSANLLGVSQAVAADTPKSWITLGDAAYAQLQKAAPLAIARESRLIQAGTSSLSGSEKVHLVEVDDQQMRLLSAAIHQELKRCGGFMYHASESAGKQALTKAPASLAASSRPSYAIDQQALVTPVLAQMQDSNIAQTIVDLSGFTNRYYNTSGGVNASNWLKQKWSTMASGRSDISVSQFTHAGYSQKSVILTINGSDNGAEVVVLGAHLDSINQNGSGESMRAPGADDDASGIASMTEALRAMLANGYVPRRTIKLIAYAAEEVGLRGSQEIAQNFKANNVNVVGVMQLDMTNYKGSPNDIYIYTDYTDSQQNAFAVKLINTYLPTLSIGYDTCGYGCSDHASWTAQGYAASMPFETAFSQDNPHIHSANDTYANSGNQALHALKFARLAAAYAIELGSDGPGALPPPDKVETFSGSLAKNQKKTFGPFKAAGGSFKAVLSGSGDSDLYVRKNTAPTTTSYDCKSDGPSSAETCSISLAVNGDVYVLLNGYATTSSYTLTVTYPPQ